VSVQHNVTGHGVVLDTSGWQSVEQLSCLWLTPGGRPDNGAPEMPDGLGAVRPGPRRVAGSRWKIPPGREMLMS
jgi:hypothetical protein